MVPIFFPVRGAASNPGSPRRFRQDRKKGTIGKKAAWTFLASKRAAAKERASHSALSPVVVLATICSGSVVAMPIARNNVMAPIISVPTIIAIPVARRNTRSNLGSGRGGMSKALRGCGWEHQFKEETGPLPPKDLPEWCAIRATPHQCASSHTPRHRGRGALPQRCRCGLCIQSC
jgi:hypothetical protein